MKKFYQDENIIFTNMKNFIAFRIDGAGDPDSRQWRFCQICDRPEILVWLFNVSKNFGNTGSPGRYYLRF